MVMVETSVNEGLVEVGRGGRGRHCGRGGVWQQCLMTGRCKLAPTVALAARHEVCVCATHSDLETGSCMGSWRGRRADDQHACW
jgi:hypothetical protein